MHLLNLMLLATPVVSLLGIWVPTPEPARDNTKDEVPFLPSLPSGVMSSPRIGLGRAAWIAFFNDESGQDIIEYGLIAAFLGLAAVAAVNAMASSVGSGYNGVGSSLTSSV